MTASLELEAPTRPRALAGHDLAVTGGEGVHLEAEDGTRYLDFGASHGATPLGHAHPRLVEALREQAGGLATLNQAYANDVRARFLQDLLEAAPDPLERAVAVNSGAEAVEAALRFARASTDGDGIVAFRNAFHGRTLGALSCTWDPGHREPFEPLLPEVTHAGYGDLEEAKEAVDDDTAAILVEPVQGEGGVRLPPEGFLEGLRDLADDHGALLVADEVQTGLGRTGSMWGVDHAGVEPDIMCLAKGLAGGFPMGLTLLSPGADGAPSGSHGSTFGGNPLACAAAQATLDVVREEDLPARAAELGDRLLEGLEGIDHRLVREARGRGLMAALELRVRATPLLRSLREQGVLALRGGATIVRLLPPLVVEEDHVDEAVAAVAAGLEEARK